jgi:DNA-binding MarR family transcriptional regulator
MSRKSSTPDEPDLAILLVAANRVLVDRLRQVQASAGLAVKPSWGFVVRALYDNPMSLSDLAGMLDVTKQAALQTVSDMEIAGLLERQPDRDDRRRKVLALTAAGRNMRTRARQESRRLEQEVRTHHGARAVTSLREVLLGIVERHGDIEDVMALRSRFV